MSDGDMELFDRLVKVFVLVVVWLLLLSVAWSCVGVVVWVVIKVWFAAWRVLQWVSG